MPEPDLPPLNLNAEFIAAALADFPLMPKDYVEKFQGQIADDTLEILLDYVPLMKKLAKVKDAKRVSNWFASVLLAEEKSAEYLNDLPSAKQLDDLSEMTEKNELSSTGAKEVFLRFFDPEMSTRDTRTIAKELNLLQENDLTALEQIVDVILSNPETRQAQADFKAGQEKVIGFLVGQVMKESKGKANPAVVQQILRKKLAQYLETPLMIC